jgi:hypothetical protein
MLTARQSGAVVSPLLLALLLLHQVDSLPVGSSVPSR